MIDLVYFDGIKKMNWVVSRKGEVGDAQQISLKNFIKVVLSISIDEYKFWMIG